MNLFAPATQLVRTLCRAGFVPVFLQTEDVDTGGTAAIYYDRIKHCGRNKWQIVHTRSGYEYLVGKISGEEIKAEFTAPGVIVFHAKENNTGVVLTEIYLLTATEKGDVRKCDLDWYVYGDEDPSDVFYVAWEAVKAKAPRRG